MRRDHVHPTDNLGNVYLAYSQEILRLATTENVNTVLRENDIDP